jgi:hypothetical protein
MPADSGVNEKRFCIGFRVGFGPFAMASATTSVENPMVKSKKLRGLWLLRNFTSVTTSDDC